MKLKIVTLLSVDSQRTVENYYDVSATDYNEITFTPNGSTIQVGMVVMTGVR